MRPPGYVVDSIHSPEEALRRFRAGLDAPDFLAGPTSREELYRRFTEALSRTDRAALEALVVTKAEYAFLVYPELRISRPPYHQPPDIAWMLASAASSGGATKLLGRAARFVTLGYSCEAQPAAEGALRIWRECVVDIRDAQGQRARRLFGAIVERDDRYKFASLTNAF